MNEENEKLRIHFTYCVVILVLLLIAVATDRWTTQQRFTEYLSNAATLTSLVLGLVAIFYSFVANDGLSKSLGGIADVSNEVRQSKEQIASYLELTKASTETARDNATAIDRVSTEVGSTLAELNGTLAAIKLQTGSLNETVSGLPTRLDLLESKVIDATKLLGEKTQVPPAPAGVGKVDPRAVKRFLQVSALSANLLTYACVLAKQKGKQLALDPLCVAIDTKLQAYFSGFLACMDAAQLIDRTPVRDQPRVYEVSAVHETLIEGTREYITSYLDRAYKDKPEVLASWLEKMQKVEALFADA